MRYYSDELKRFFDSEPDCLAAEEKHKQELEEQKQTKSKLAKKVKDAEKLVDDAYTDVSKAEEQVKALQKKYYEDVEVIMDPAMAKLKHALEQRKEALQEFNKHYGVYTTSYTGNDALNEFLKIEERLNKLWKHFYF